MRSLYETRAGFGAAAAESLRRAQVKAEPTDAEILQELRGEVLGLKQTVNTMARLLENLAGEVQRLSVEARDRRVERELKDRVSGFHQISWPQSGDPAFPPLVSQRSDVTPHYPEVRVTAAEDTSLLARVVAEWQSSSASEATPGKETYKNPNWWRK